MADIHISELGVQVDLHVSAQALPRAVTEVLRVLQALEELQRWGVSGSLVLGLSPEEEK
jgi:hypothetical protein